MYNKTKQNCELNTISLCAVYLLFHSFSHSLLNNAHDIVL